MAHVMIVNTHNGIKNITDTEFERTNLLIWTAISTVIYIIGAVTLGKLSSILQKNN